MISRGKPEDLPTRIELNYPELTRDDIILLLEQYGLSRETHRIMRHIKQSILSTKSNFAYEIQLKANIDDESSHTIKSSHHTPSIDQASKSHLECKNISNKKNSVPIPSKKSVGTRTHHSPAVAKRQKNLDESKSPTENTNVFLSRSKVPLDQSERYFLVT